MIKQVISKLSFLPSIRKRTVTLPHPFRFNCVGYTGNSIESLVVFDEKNKTSFAGCLATFSHLVNLLLQCSESLLLKVNIVNG